MKTFLTFLKKNHHYLWLVAAGCYASIGASDMVVPMLLFFIADDAFDKIESFIKQPK